MDNKTFQLLKYLSTLDEPKLDDSWLRNYQESFDYLKKRRFIAHRSGRLDIRVTLLGYEQLEFQERNERLLALQEQNTMIQETLKRIQLWLVVLTFVGLIVQVVANIIPKLR
jgi:hypothetical protein